MTKLLVLQQPLPLQPLVVETARVLPQSVATSPLSVDVAKPSLPMIVAVSRWTWQQRTSLQASKGVNDQSFATMKCDVLSFSSDALVPTWL